MSVTFTDENKQEMGAFFSEGIHKVKISAIVAGETDQGKEYFEFTVAGDNGEEGSARIWWTTDNATKYSFNVIKNIFVHNTVEKNRDQIKAKVDAVKTTDELLDLCQALVGKEAWYQVTKSDRTYVNNAGETKNSYDRNITGYEPKPAKKTAAQLEDELKAEGGKPVDVNEIPFD